MSTDMQGTELNYPVVDKKAYVVFKVVKQFKIYCYGEKFLWLGVPQQTA